MFVLMTEHTSTAAEREPHHAAHVAWSAACFEAGNFLAAGPRVPHGGGITIARARTRADIEALVATDPYARHGLSRYAVHEFAEAPAPHRWPGLDDFLGQQSDQTL